MPALLKAVLEQVFRPTFAFEHVEKGFPKGRMKGKSARVIVTMGMPAPVYRWWFLAHGVRGLERSILSFCGISPVRETLIGSVDAASPPTRDAWMKKVRALGRKAA